ncbi:MAG TPA: sulfite exporter TauE/SafE family protein, partial [Chloroflexota bacterium]
HGHPHGHDDVPSHASAHVHAPAHRHAQEQPHLHADHHFPPHDGHARRSRHRSLEHEHDGIRHQHALPGAGQITPRGLIALGVSGGLLPCPSALVVLLAAISLQRVAFGIVLVIAFSIGLAGVLTGIGLLLVYARGFFSRFRLEAGAGRFLPAASAAVVLLLGVAISVQAVAQSGLFA